MFKLKFIFLLKKSLSEGFIFRILEVNRIIAYVLQYVLHDFFLKNVICVLFVIIISKKGLESTICCALSYFLVSSRILVKLFKNE